MKYVPINKPIFLSPEIVAGENTLGSSSTVFVNFNKRIRLALGVLTLQLAFTIPSTHVYFLEDYSHCIKEDQSWKETVFSKMHAHPKPHILPECSRISLEEPCVSQ